MQQQQLPVVEGACWVVVGLLQGVVGVAYLQEVQAMMALVMQLQVHWSWLMLLLLLMLAWLLAEVLQRSVWTGVWLRIDSIRLLWGLDWTCDDDATSVIICLRLW